jgi:hypothetical protein
VDGDADGVRDPQDLDDAALAAGVYLCAAPGDLAAPAQARKAVFAFNHSHAYVHAVMAFARQYRHEDFAVTSAAFLLGPLPPVDVTVVGGAARRSTAARAAVRTPEPAARSVRPTTQRTSIARATTSEPGRDPVADPAPRPEPKLGSGSTGAPATEPAAGQEPTPSSGASDPGPTPPPDRTPDPEPTPEPTSPPAPDPSVATLEGTWTACGDGGYCVGATPIDLGTPDLLAGSAAADYDGDGQVEDYSAELAGLEGQDVVVTVRPQDSGAVLLTVNGLAYPPTAGLG